MLYGIWYQLSDTNYGFDGANLKWTIAFIDINKAHAYLSNRIYIGCRSVEVKELPKTPPDGQEYKLWDYAK